MNNEVVWVSGRSGFLGRKLPGLLIALLLLSLLGAACNPFKKSGFSNCVIVDDEKDFTGEYLKHSRAAVFKRMPTPEIVEKDKEIDKGDGPRKGRVRWAECSVGPDCHEAGMH